MFHFNVFEIILFNFQISLYFIFHLTTYNGNVLLWNPQLGLRILKDGDINNLTLSCDSNLSRDSNLRRGSNMVCTTWNCIQWLEPGRSIGTGYFAVQWHGLNSLMAYCNLYINLACMFVCLFVCLFLSNKRQKGWTDQAHIFCGTPRDHREGLWMIKIKKKI